MTMSVRAFFVAAAFAFGAVCGSGFPSPAQEKAKDDKGKGGEIE